MEEDETRIDDALELINKIFPETSDKIATIGFVNWHNIINHCALEDLNAKETLFVANLILALASTNFNKTSQNALNISDSLKQVSFEDTLDFLTSNDEDEGEEVEDD